MNIHEYAVTTADGQTQRLGDYDGQVLLIVNVASECGFTPQYAGLELLQREFGPRGLQVLGFPCNQFGAQEPGSDEEIQSFCSLTYDVTFPVFAKVDVNGPDADPLFAYLREQAPVKLAPGHDLYDHIMDTTPERAGENDIWWNFTKFLIGRDGAVLRRYESDVTPETIAADLPQSLG